MHCSALLALPLLLAPAARQEQPPQEPTPSIEAPRGVEVTFLANDGFHLRSGPYNVLIDAYLRDPYGIYAALPAETFQDLALARPPYDGQLVALVSHSHPDHVQFRVLDRLLTNNPKALLVTSGQVLSAFAKAAKDREALEGRMTAVHYRPGFADKLGLVKDEMSISFLPLRHAGGANSDVQNLGHLIELGGLKILHVGDADPAADNFRPYDLAHEQLDVAIVPFWYFGSEAALSVLHEEIKARHVIAAHVPPSELAALKEHLDAEHPDVILFEEAGQSRTFDPVE
jgi:L-ascorbate metabolism protein UlaG (beta-lactamase superfamily)